MEPVGVRLEIVGAVLDPIGAGLEPARLATVFGSFGFKFGLELEDLLPKVGLKTDEAIPGFRFGLELAEKLIPGFRFGLEFAEKLITGLSLDGRITGREVLKKNK